MIGFLKAPFLVLHCFYQTLMTFLMMLPVTLLYVLIILLSTLSGIRQLICGNAQMKYTKLCKMTTSKPRKLSSRMSPTIWLNYWAIWKESEFLDVLFFLIENTTSLKYFFYWTIVNFYELPLSQGQIDHIFLVLTST